MTKQLRGVSKPFEWESRKPTGYASQHRDRYKPSVSLFATNLTTTILKVLHVDLGVSIVSSFSDFIKRD